MTTNRVRRARKARVGCHGIRPGELYVEHTSFPGPGDDAGYATAAGHPVRLAECRACAERYGRGHLFDAHKKPNMSP